MAAQNGHTEIVKLLLDANADVNAANTNGLSPLYMAAQKGHTEVVKLLLVANADVNLKGSFKDTKYTPLEIARVRGHEDIVRILEDFPYSKFTQGAKSAEEKIYILQTIMTNTVSAYEEYLAVFPDGVFAIRAKLIVKQHHLFQACLSGNTKTTESLIKSDISLSSYDEAAVELMAILQRQMPKKVMTISNFDVDKFDDSAVPDSKQALLTFKLLLHAGADPKAMRIKGFEKAGKKNLGMVTTYGTGNPGKIVPALEGGMSALEFAEANSLEDFKIVLLNAGGKQD
jgi:ankyrin repeat protein